MKRLAKLGRPNPSSLDQVAASRHVIPYPLAIRRRWMLIDVSMPIQPGSVFRLGSPPVEIARRKCSNESEGEYEAVVVTMPAHTATHIDVVFSERRISPERMIGEGKLIDVTGVSGGPIQLNDIDSKAMIHHGDFVFFRTDWTKYAGTDSYYRHPELSFEVVQWLASTGVNAVGIDALGLGLDRRHSEFDRFLARSDVFVIENLANLCKVPNNEFRVYCFPLSIEGMDAMPARVLVDTDG
jgi:kynurenine formamidase